MLYSSAHGLTKLSFAGAAFTSRSADLPCSGLSDSGAEESRSTAPLLKSIRNFERVEIALLPPLALLTCGVDVVTVGDAEWNCELIAHLQALEIAHSGRGERERVSVRRSGKADLRRRGHARKQSWSHAGLVGPIFLKLAENYLAKSGRFGIARQHGQ
jgi:hypothetical protein